MQSAEFVCETYAHVRNGCRHDCRSTRHLRALGGPREVIRRF
jgi:hypothetical protein